MGYPSDRCGYPARPPYIPGYIVGNHHLAARLWGGRGGKAGGLPRPTKVVCSTQVYKDRAKSGVDYGPGSVQERVERGIPKAKNWDGQGVGPEH